MLTLQRAERASARARQLLLPPRAPLLLLLLLLPRASSALFARVDATLGRARPRPRRCLRGVLDTTAIKLRPCYALMVVWLCVQTAERILPRLSGPDIIHCSQSRYRYVGLLSSSWCGCMESSNLNTIGGGVWFWC